MGSKNSEELYPYFDVTATHNGITITRRYETGVSYIGCPFFIVKESTGTGTACACDNIQTKLDTLQNALLSQLGTKIDTQTTDITTAITASKDALQTEIINENEQKGFV